MTWPVGRSEEALGPLDVDHVGRRRRSAGRGRDVERGPRRRGTGPRRGRELVATPRERHRMGPGQRGQGAGEVGGLAAADLDRQQVPGHRIGCGPAEEQDMPVGRALCRPGRLCAVGGDDQVGGARVAGLHRADVLLGGVDAADERRRGREKRDPYRPRGSGDGSAGVGPAPGREEGAHDDDRPGHAVRGKYRSRRTPAVPAAAATSTPTKR